VTVEKKLVSEFEEEALSFAAAGKGFWASDHQVSSLIARFHWRVVLFYTQKKVAYWRQRVKVISSLCVPLCHATLFNIILYYLILYFIQNNKKRIFLCYILHYDQSENYQLLQLLYYLCILCLFLHCYTMDDHYARIMHSLWGLFSYLMEFLLICFMSMCGRADIWWLNFRVYAS
jgi:hypothetical protein